jgi:hypothetical protein
MELDHSSAARSLVEGIDILGDDRPEPPSGFPLGQRQVGGIWIRLQTGLEDLSEETGYILGAKEEFGQQAGNMGEALRWIAIP